MTRAAAARASVVHMRWTTVDDYSEIGSNRIESAELVNSRCGCHIDSRKRMQTSAADACALAALRGAAVRQRHSRAHRIAMHRFRPTVHSGTHAACDAGQPRERVRGTVPATVGTASLRRVL